MLSFVIIHQFLGKMTRMVGMSYMILYLIVERPLMETRLTATAEIILLAQLNATLLGRMRSVVVAIIVQDLFLAMDSADDGDNGHVTITVADYVGVARVVDETQTRVGGCCDIIEVSFADLNVVGSGRTEL